MKSVQQMSRPVRSSGQDNRVRPVVHWLPFPVVLSVGAVVHWQLGQRGWWTALSVSVFLALSAALSVYAWQAAKPRGQLIRGQVTATVSVNLALVALIMIFGVVRPVFWLSAALSMSLSLSWTIRRVPAVHGEGKDGHGAGADNAFGLSIVKAKTIKATAERAEAEWKLGDGQTLESVHPKLGALGNELGTIRRGVRVTETDREGVVRVHAIYRDVLRETRPWGGPANPGGSIADGITWGDYEDTEPCTLYPAGNYAKNIAPGHTGLTGMTRAGKGVCMHVVCAELSTKRDVSPLIVLDERKGRQTTDNIDAAIGIYADTPAKVRAVIKGLDNAVAARAQALGECGYKSWTPEAAADPRLRMGALFVLYEEAATYAKTCENDLVRIAEAGLSAGVFGFVSAQLWKHDRIPTSLRSQIANVIAYGLGSTEDASYLLSDTTLANGNDPGQWGTRFPGRYACELNGVPTERFSLPAKGYLAEDEQLQAVTDEWGPKMLPYDRVTLAAFGTAYERYTPRRPGAPGYAGPVKAPVTSGNVEVVMDEANPIQAVTNRMRQLEDEDADRQCAEDTRPIPEEEDGMYGVPELDDAELAAMAAAVDLEAPLPEWTGPDIDMNPEPTPGARTWTAAEKREAFARMMLRLAKMPGGMTRLYKTSELYDEWIAELGCEAEAMRPERLHDLLSEADEAGQMEREVRGKWRIVTLVEPLQNVT